MTVRNPIEYLLFVTFFPQLIAGPIVFYREVVPQFCAQMMRGSTRKNVAIGSGIFLIGLFKKVVLADTLGEFVDPVFTQADNGDEVATGGAWLGSIAFTLQIYFDFSGYSDMAIGLARMFGIRLPVNFHSPLKATSMIEFWRTWHVTLTRVITAYVYQPLALATNRLATKRKFSRFKRFGFGTVLPLLITFIAVGIWHGAGWNFVIFGALHGLYMSINTCWRELIGNRLEDLGSLSTQILDAGFRGLTFVALAFSLVFFRAESFDGAVRLVSSQFGGSGSQGVFSTDAFAWEGIGLTVFLLAFVWVVPNTQELFIRYRPALNIQDFVNRAEGKPFIRWRASKRCALITSLGGLVALGLVAGGYREFIYFDF